MIRPEGMQVSASDPSLYVQDHPWVVQDPAQSVNSTRITVVRHPPSHAYKAGFDPNGNKLTSSYGDRDVQIKKMQEQLGSTNPWHKDDCYFIFPADNIPPTMQRQAASTHYAAHRYEDPHKGASGLDAVLMACSLADKTRLGSLPRQMVRQFVILHGFGGRQNRVIIDQLLRHHTVDPKGNARVLYPQFLQLMRRALQDGRLHCSSLVH